MLTPSEKSQIKIILQTPQWQTIERLANQLCDAIAYSSKIRDSEWDTLRATVGDDGQIRGIKKLIQELYENAK